MENIRIADSKPEMRLKVSDNQKKYNSNLGDNLNKDEIGVLLANTEGSSSSELLLDSEEEQITKHSRKLGVLSGLALGFVIGQNRIKEIFAGVKKLISTKNAGTPEAVIKGLTKDVALNGAIGLGILGLGAIVGLGIGKIMANQERKVLEEY